MTQNADRPASVDGSPLATESAYQALPLGRAGGLINHKEYT